MDLNFTSEQMSFINEPSQNIFLNACPGAGKTKVIVERFVKQAEIFSHNFKRKNIAALSFTNVAVEEITKRCTSKGLLRFIEYPNFIGTFDSFIIRFIFRQLYKKKFRIFDSWDSLGVQVENKSSIIPLSSFTFDHNQISCTSTRYESVYNKDKKQWDFLAAKQRNKLLSHHLMIPTEIRNFIEESDTSEKNKIYNYLSKRFAEIIVDEIQDCNEQDLTILESLRSLGVAIVMVGDLDQSIYSFRGVSITKIKDFISSHKELKLSKNFRSSQNICNLAASLKESKIIDISQAEYKDDITPVIVLPYKKGQISRIGERYEYLFSTKGILRENCKIIAYKESTALSTYGINRKKIGTSSYEQVAQSINIYKNESASLKERERAIKIIEKYILKLLDININNLATEECCERNNIDYRWLKRCALFLVSNLPAPSEISCAVEWISQFKSVISTLPVPPNNTHKWIKTGKVFKYTGKWRIEIINYNSCFFSTIHRVKGSEFDSVLVVFSMSDSESIKKWSESKIGESERVFFVALTRAKKMLCVAVEYNALSLIQTIMQKYKICYDFDLNILNGN